MTESELEIFSQDLAVVSWVNSQFKTDFKFEQLNVTFKKFVLKSGNETILIGDLKTCDTALIGMVAFANTLLKDKEPLSQGGQFMNDLNLENGAILGNSYYFNEREHEWEDMLETQTLRELEESYTCEHCGASVSKYDYKDYCLADGTCLCEQCNCTVTNNKSEEVSKK